MTGYTSRKSFAVPKGLNRKRSSLPHHAEQALRVVARMVTKAEGHLADGLRYVLLLPRSLHRLRVAAMLPLMFAARTLAVTRDNPMVLHGAAKISRHDVSRIVSRTMAMGWSNRWVASYYRSLLSA